MPTALLKGGVALMGVGGVGGVGLGGWAVSSYMNSKDNTIKTILKSEGYKLTSELPVNEQSNAWDKVLKTYKLESTEDLKIKVEGVSSSSEIKDWCLKHLESKNRDSFFNKAKKWCVIYSTFADKLKSDGKELEADEGNLNTKYNSLGDLKSVVDAVQVTESDDNNLNGKKLKKWCEDKSYSSHSSEVNNFYEKFKDHCTKAQ